MLLKLAVARRSHPPCWLLGIGIGLEGQTHELHRPQKEVLLQMGGPEGVLAVERYALVTGPVGGMAMHAIPRQPPLPAEP